jgi:hypothetical protein
VQAQEATDYEPSDERSSFEERRKSILDANTLRATYHNFGFNGRTDDSNVDELYYEFPKNTNRRYIYFISIFTGAEVTNQQTGEDLQVVVAPNYRTNPQTGDSWDQNPIEGYYNEDSEELARSDQGPGSSRGNTWPDVWPDKLDDPNDPGWPDQWNGFFGKDIFNADQEFFYRSGDDLYTRLSNDGRWLPDPEDPSRGGLGLVMDTRILAWTQNLISNVHFNIFEIRNDSRFDYDKVSFMLWTADWVGTPEQDVPFFDQERSIAFYTDSQPTQSPPEFDDTPIGVAAIRFLETPGNDFDGIDNNGNSDFYLGGGTLYDQTNEDLYPLLTEDGGGFISEQSIIETEITPQFTDQSFQDRVINPGDPIVVVDSDGNRTLFRYPPEEAGDVTITTFDATNNEREVLLPAGGITVREDTLDGLNRNLIDDDLDGLIDENQPNHLTLSRFLPGDDVPTTRAVRHINYLWNGYYGGHNGNFGINEIGWAQDNEGNWSPSDSLNIQRGMIVPDQWIESRISNDEDFASLINERQEALKELYSRRPSEPVFPEEFFDTFYLNEFTAAPMIDESREDFHDNNIDWTMRDDVGIDGAEGSGNRGEGDGFPSSGAFTSFPGEPNIDKTDVRETDAIGITSATSLSAGSLVFNDSQIWRRYMVPGLFPEAPPAAQDTDQLITSSFFQLGAGSIQRFAVATSVAQTGTSDNAADQELVTQQLDDAFRAFDANYQFAVSPPPPVLRAVPGDGHVVLYWDDSSEDVFDRFLERLGENGRNFEGYRVYRSTDPALVDARNITDGQGNLQFLEPIAQFDLDNGITGNHPIDINGLEFYLGDDSGLQRHFVDTDVINGRTYYYVVTGYNSGAAGAGIAPGESAINLSINPDGSLSAGDNVLFVSPGMRAAGFTAAEVLQIRKTDDEGQATGTVIGEVVDPRELQVNTTYRITFEDEERTSASGEVWRETTGFTLTDVTNGRIIFEERDEFNGEDLPVVDGVKLIVANDTYVPDGGNKAAGSSKKRLRVADWQSDVYGDDVPATLRAEALAGSRNNYKIEFLTPRRAAVTTSRSASMRVERGNLTMQAQEREVPFRVINTETGEPVEFGFVPHNEIEDSERGAAGFAARYDAEERRTISDLIYIREPNPDTGKMQTAWKISMEPYEAGEVFAAGPGDAVLLNQSTEFTSDDVFEFTIDESLVPTEDQSQAASDMDNIRVVPNPYIGANVLEQRPSGADQTITRQLMFTNLPAQCTIRIFSVSGRLVQTLSVNNDIYDGTYKWDMLTKDNLGISYGVYIYHVEAPGIGEKVGKFAVIK